MSVTYGVGVARALGGGPVEARLQSFADATGVFLREVVGDRVIEVGPRGAGMAPRWLSVAESAPIVTRLAWLGGAAPAGFFPPCLAASLYLPEEPPRPLRELHLPGSPLDGAVVSTARRALKGLGEYADGDAPAGVADAAAWGAFRAGLRELLAFCVSHGLVARVSGGGRR